jgi:hypothetical protein
MGGLLLKNKKCAIDYQDINADKRFFWLLPDNSD